MARKQTTILTCDRDGCRNYSEVIEGESPDGWLMVYPTENHKYVSRAFAFEFCSEKCLALWANARKNFKKNGTEITPESRKIIPPLESLSVTDRILELFESDPTAELTAADVEEFLGTDSKNVRTMVNNLARDGRLRVVRVNPRVGSARETNVYSLNERNN